MEQSKDSLQRETWEYFAAYISWEQSNPTAPDWNSDNSKPTEITYDWLIKFSGGAQIVGMINILDHFGSIGWELVNLAPLHFSNSSVTSYYAAFKRKKINKI